MTYTNITYRPLGEFIKLVDERNKDLKISNLLGISVTKEFIPSIANTIGTDMSTYKIVKPRQFVYIADTSRRGDKIAVALLKEKESISLVSSIYTVFEVLDFNQLLPEYLMMWFLRPEFDRYARFHSHGSAREIFDWDELCATQIPVPPIEEQHRIVEQYNAVQRRIEIQTKLITKLQDTAQALYKKTFVDGIDKDHLPDGWRMGTLGEEFDITIGRTPPRNECKWFSLNDKDNLWVSIADMVCDGFILDTKEKLINEAIVAFHIPVVPANSILMSFKMTVGRIAITTKRTLTNEAIAHFICKDENFVEYIYLFLKNIDYKGLGSTSSITDSINTKVIGNISIIIPAKDCLTSFHDDAKVIFNAILNHTKEIEKLKTIQSSLLARMGR